MSKVKEILNKVGAFNIVWIISLCVALAFVGSIQYGAYFTTINFVLDKNVTDADVVIELADNSYGTEVTIENSEVEVSAYLAGNKIKSIEILIPEENVNCLSVEAKARYKTLKSYDITEERVLVDYDSNQTTFTITESLIGELNESFTEDWTLKADIMLFIIGLFVIIKVIELFFSYKIYKRFSYICLLLLLLGFVLTYGKDYNVRYIDELNIGGGTSTTPVSNEEFFYQTFIARENTVGIRIRLSTFMETLQGTYEIRIYDRDENCVTRKVVPGSEVKDNEYYYVAFDQKLSAGEFYKFTVVKTDTEFLDEKMCLWRNYNDRYTEGELWDNKTDMTGDIEFDMYEEGVNLRSFLLYIVLVLYVLFLICKRGNEDEKNFNKYALCMYAGVLLIFLSRVAYCVQYENLGVYDEMAHVSFIAYFEENPNVIVPDYAEATLLIPDSNAPLGGQQDVVGLNQNKGIFYGRNTETVNYLGHQALYYKLMSLTNSVTTDGVLTHVNLDRLRLVNVAIIVLALLITFYVGFTRIKKDMYYHLLYAAICTSMPLLYMMAPMINNDNLCFLAMAIYMLGVVRVSEGKRDIFSYLCIALGICMSALTKLTGTLFVAIISVFFVVRVCIKEKNFSVILNKAFMITLPLYLFVVGYYIANYMMYGSFRVSLAQIIGAKEYYNYPIFGVDLSNRVFRTVYDLYTSNLRAMASHWNKRGILLVDHLKLSAYAYYLRTAILVLPLALPIINLKDKKREKTANYYIFEGIAVSIIFSVFYQLLGAVSGYYAYGRISVQSRYYLCMLPMFAYSIMYFLNYKVDKHFCEDKRIIINGKNVISIDTIIHFIICACALILLVM